MRSSLDAMELGAKSAHGSILVNWFTSVACNAFGLHGTERMAFRVPANAIPGMLARVRQISNEWPPLAEMWTNERSFALGSDTDLFRQLQRVPLSKRLDAIESLSPSYQTAGRWDTIKRALTPRVVVLSDTNHYYKGQIAQSEKPVRQRVRISPPADAWSDMVFSIDLSQDSWRLERAHTGLALLEVALAVRMYYLEHGRYPIRLTAISHRWLPEVPRDLWDQPIAYRLKNGQPVIYSLGPDGKDDGGQPADPIDLSRTTRGDLVFGHLSHHLHGR
jgi:hypothetical protein